MTETLALTKTLVLGLGNLVHADDGVGVRAIQWLDHDPRIPVDVVLLDGGTQGLGLLHHTSGVRRLLVIDAIDAGEPAGTRLRFEGKALQVCRERRACINWDSRTLWLRSNYSASLRAKLRHLACSRSLQGGVPS